MQSLLQPTGNMVETCFFLQMKSLYFPLGIVPKLKNIIDRATGVPYDVTLEIKEHSVDAELLQDINRKSISCVLDYIQQDGERHCVFIDSLETRDTFGILYTPWIPCIPWILWNGSSEEIFFSASTVGEIILDIQKLMFTKLVTKYFR